MKCELLEIFTSQGFLIRIATQKLKKIGKGLTNYDPRGRVVSLRLVEAEEASVLIFSLDKSL